MRPRIVPFAFALLTACSGAVEPQDPGPTPTGPDALPPPGQQLGQRSAPEELAPLVPAPKEARLTLTTPKEGEVVKNPVAVSFTTTGLTLGPAGAPTPGQGYAVVMVDGRPVPAGEPVTRREQVIHLDDGAAALSLTVGPGAHTLTVQSVDGLGRSYGEALSATVSFTVNPELVDEQR
ncbi:MAG: hypothetical protein RIT28_4616 [Pseudomonadota bacterium]